ncbi:MAG TPA: serpin family protein [Kofleriaceae bacterium]|jgi:serpin B
MTRHALACLVLLGCRSKPTEPASAPPPPPPAPVTAPVPKDKPVWDDAPISAATNAMAFDLYKQVSGTPGNLALSPVSIELALGMTWAGAKGATASQLGDALHLGPDVARDLADLGIMQRTLGDGTRGVTLRLANRLYGEQSFAFVPAFQGRMKGIFDAPLEAVDFKTAADAARVTINGWVAAQTNDKIEDLLPAGALDAMTRLVLVNAIYFLGDWQSPFDSAATNPAPFTPLGAAAHDVPTMHQRITVAIAKANGARLFALPYKGGATAMLIALPDAPAGIAALEAKLDAKAFDAWRAALAMKEIDLALPRFTVDPPASIELKQAFAALGVKDAFDEHAADFTQIGTPPEPDMRLYISKIFHKAFVKVDEKGTEAAGATAVVMAVGGGMPQPAEPVKVDHPFLFWIVDQKTGLILFSGRVVDPGAK